MEKKRKIDSECRKFKDQWNIQYFVIESSNKALCLICNESIAVLKEYNMKRHYETKHSQNYSKYTGIMRTEKFEALKRGLKSQQSLFTKVKTEQEAATRASFRVALEIAKRGKPFTDGEMIKECIIAVVEEMCPEKVNLLKTVSMSANTVARRVENIAENISSQLFDKNGHVEWFSLALDESTDVSDTTQVLIYIRGVDKSYEVHEELLDMYSIHGTTTGTQKRIRGESEASERGNAETQLRPAGHPPTNELSATAVCYLASNELTYCGASPFYMFKCYVTGRLAPWRRGGGLPYLVADCQFSPHTEIPFSATIPLTAESSPAAGVHTSFSNFFWVLSPLDTKSTSPTVHRHRMRRKIWNRFFEPKSRSRILQLKMQFVNIKLQTGLPDSFDTLVMSFENVEDSDFISNTRLEILYSQSMKEDLPREKQVQVSAKHSIFQRMTLGRLPENEGVKCYRCSKNGVVPGRPSTETTRRKKATAGRKTLLNLRRRYAHGLQCSLFGR
ncbi:EPM2AIP1 [Cordylochernes scorpioides]|uniref:EPM2AIP1 n=1 Tax=Cordylochernes scorpioides TaxID=51811 RepID=A0ABY6K2N5_9ARAC|nr:EPM2AIP1 [Cordylochernes scorpioides]